MCYAHGVDLLVPPRPRFGVPEFCFSGFSVALGLFCEVVLFIGMICI